MKKTQLLKFITGKQALKTSIKTVLKEEGKFLHRTRVTNNRAKRT